LEKQKLTGFSVVETILKLTPAMPVALNGGEKLPVDMNADRHDSEGIEGSCLVELHLTKKLFVTTFLPIPLPIALKISRPSLNFHSESIDLSTTHPCTS
jgi:hypothetical protein